ncbi:GNAT family N-acetyltransferase [Kineosporia sp. J2-2]|uniref:GNAT family N-acetyltransferase n=1 Tax=Kineosporia corallincola TaxID=2835133 RepID=A0ABS5TBW0_9ACTN|nr:GNAT family N-acetyltransferase [Kineosporia corallincola]MBT0768573.1 GNAT family N-acetyltransferase [Kineosporia corallincola]
MSTVLLITGSAGPTVDYTLPKVAAVADVVLLPLTPLPAGLRLPAGVRVTGADETARMRGPGLVGRLVDLARTYRVDGILTFSEYSVVAAARAAGQLGLPGAGRHAVLARDKLLMRERWARAGVPVPRFRGVDGPEEIEQALADFGEPVLLKTRLGCGSLGQVVVRDPAQARDAWAAARGAVAVADADLDVDACRDLEMTGLMVETLIPGSTRSWYGSEGYGDYLSVEGLVVGGEWRPVCITGRLPTIEPFTELSNQAPCALPADRQRIVEDAARRAVEALGLETCGTHTEMKLLDGQEVCLLETAARPGGAAIARQVEAVFGVDLVTQLTHAVLGEPVDLPERMLTAGTVTSTGTSTGSGVGAAASVALLATDSAGRPWGTRPPFEPARVDWSPMLSPGSRIRVVSGITPGTPMPAYESADGVRNFAGLAFLEADDAATLLRDTYAVLDGLEQALGAVAGQVDEFTADRFGAEGFSADGFRVADEVPSAEETAELFGAAGLNGPLDDLPRLERMLSTAQQVITARAPGGQLVGLVRVLTDFGFNAFIADLAVRPGWQRRGLGTRLVSTAVRDQPGVKFVVQPGHDSGAFWRKLGFDPAPTCVVRGRRG